MVRNLEANNQAKAALSLFAVQGDGDFQANRKVVAKKAYPFRRSPNRERQNLCHIRKPPVTEADYDSFASEILDRLYAKFCPEHGVQLTRRISTRRYAVKCPKCRHQQSRFSHTPFHGMKLPTWHFGWIIWESLQRYPQVVTSSEIQRRLGIAKNSALLLKRRVQLFATQQTDRIKQLIHEELANRFENVRLPKVEENRNVEEVLAGRAVPHIDSLVLFSASQRANGGRKRWKHTGQTASIYMNNKLGGRQIGTLVHTFAIKKGPVLLDSISNNQAKTLMPLLDKYIPKDVPVFSDSGYDWYYRKNKNHRLVNHNRKSADKRYKWSRNRWCINGVNNQTAEGFQRNLKWHFTAGYGYIRPEFSQLYLNEYGFWKNIKYFGWDKLILPEKENQRVAAERRNKPYEQTNAENTNSTGLRQNKGLVNAERGKGRPGQKTRFVGPENEADGVNIKAVETDSVTGEKEGFRRFCDETAPTKRAAASDRLGLVRSKNAQVEWLTKAIQKQKYRPPTLEEREIAESRTNLELLNVDIQALIQKPENINLRNAVKDYNEFSTRKKKHESEMQKKYSFTASRIWECLGDDEWGDLDSVIAATGINRAKAYRIIRCWAISGIASVVDRSLPDGLNFKFIYDVKRIIPTLPEIRYVLNRAEFENFEQSYGLYVSRQYVQRKQKSKY